jgi:hypothetical protein
LETIVSNDERVAIAEVDYIIHHMNERYLNKIPQKVQDYITILKKKNIEIYVDPHIPLEKQGLKEFTLNFLIVLNLKYWCDDARRKDILAIMDNNQKNFDSKINNIFEQAESLEGDSNHSEYNGSTSRPKHVIVTGTPNIKPTNQNIVEDSSVNNVENVTQVENNTQDENDVKSEEKENALDKLKEETASALVQSSSEGFLKKIINKIKTLLTKSKQ